MEIHKNFFYDVKGVAFHAKTEITYDVSQHAIDISKSWTKFFSGGFLCILSTSCTLQAQIASENE